MKEARLVRFRDVEHREWRRARRADCSGDERGYFVVVERNMIHRFSSPVSWGYIVRERERERGWCAGGMRWNIYTGTEGGFVYKA